VRQGAPILSTLAATAAVALPMALAKAAYDLLVAWPVLGAAPPDLAGRLALAASEASNALVLALVATPALAWLARTWPRAWPWIGGAVFVVLCLAVGWGPYAFGGASGLTPAPAGPVTLGLQRLMADAGLASRDVWLSPDPAFDADVTGAFGHATVAIGRQVLGWPPAEARAYVGHVMGHWAHGDVFVLFLIDGLTGLGALLAARSFAAPLARALGARARDGADPAALPAAAMICVIAFGVATLAGASYLRWANVRADQYSLDHAREPDGLAAVLVREWNHQSLDPNPIEEALFYSHPPLPGRIAHAMAWKAAHGG